MITRGRPLLLLALVLACGPRRPPPSPHEGPAADVALLVENHNWNDIRILLLHDGTTTRLGTVTAAAETTFFVPWRYFSSGGAVRLRGMPLGAPSGITSENLLVQPGAVIRWTLEGDLGRSSLEVH